MIRHTLLLATILLSLVISSCGKDKKEIQIKSAVASFATNYDGVVGYGYVHLKQILDKSGLAEVEGLGKGVVDVFTSLESGVNMDNGIHYAFTGPFDRNGMPDNGFVFFQVENKDSLLAIFDKKMGYLFEEEDGLMIYDDMSSAIGFNDEIAIIVATQFGEKPKEVLKSAFIAANNDKKNPKVVEILNLETDILSGVNLENLYKTANTSLNNLPEERRKKLNKMVEDGHYSTTIDFNDGNITAEINTERVSDELKSKYFFKADYESTIFEKLGPGKPLIAFASAMDIKKMEEFITFLQPEGEESIIKLLGLGDQSVSDIVNGEFGFALNSAPDMLVPGMIPAFNFYASVGDNHEFLSDLANVYSEEGVIEDLGEGYYRYDSTSIAYLAKDEVLLQSNAQEKKAFKTGKLDKMSGFENFGEKPFSLYIDLEELNKAENASLGNKVELMLDLTDYVKVEADNTGAKVVIQLLNKDKNVLRQVLNAFKEDLKSQFGGGLIM